jgi:hypothetical protein
VSHARKAKRGVWAKDRTNAGFEMVGLGSITDEHGILPKLFRRLAEYLEGAVQSRALRSSWRREMKKLL